MKDLFKKYHRHKVLSNLGLLSLSAILAVSINMTLLGGQTGDTLKASILETSQKPQLETDFIIEETTDILTFRNSKLLQDVTGVSFSLAYDPEILNLEVAASSISGSQISTIKNEDGFVNYTISLDAGLDISPGSSLMTLPYEKSYTGTVYLNIINVNFSDETGGVYTLTSKGIMF